jgi:hypothetical protein
MPAGAIGRSTHVDRALVGFGVVIALSSLGFAGYMVTDVDRPPRIAGLEYLSIFARPSHSLVVAKNRSSTPALDEAPVEAAQSIDPTPTGSIPDRISVGGIVNPVPTPMGDGSAKPPASLSRLLYVSDGEALIQTDLGLRHVRAGDLLPDLGRINTIERTGDHWVLLTQNGATLEWPTQPPISAATTRKRPAPR